MARERTKGTVIRKRLIFICHFSIGKETAKSPRNAEYAKTKKEL
jgi:hypothetical protein